MEIFKYVLMFFKHLALFYLGVIIAARTSMDNSQIDFVAIIWGIYCICKLTLDIYDEYRIDNN